MSMTGVRLPYPGLRAFTHEETDLFFGREGCVDDMVDRLAETRFLAVLGPSGSGKSSLVKTGLLDALEIGLLRQAGSRWLIADFRPGDRPIHNLAEGLLRAAAPNPADQADEEEVKFLRTFLARGPRSVIEWCEAENLPNGANLLLLVDQFEELFRYSAYAEREEAEAFVALLLESAHAPLAGARIYVAITMRSEYLGAAALIDGLAEAINQGLYLTPRMSRDQVREAIVGPAAVCGFSIEPALVNRLLNDLTSFAPWEEGDTGHQLERLVRRADQLPLMQHVLNRLFSLAEERSGGGTIELKLSDYDALGGLRGALAAHGREILEELLPEHREVASAVFRALTAGSSLAEAVRRPTEFGELVEIGGDEIAVREIVEAFRAPGRNFLVPPRPAALRPKTVIDISHESLIRQWDEFAGWLQREITSAETWRRLVDAAERYKRGEANLLSGLALASIANWWDTDRPTAAWTKRYGGDFAQAADFLAESRRAEEAAKQAEIDERRQKSRNRLITAAIVVILCIITPLAGLAGYMAWSASREAEAADRARALAESERQVAETERQRADQERTRAVGAQQEAVQQAQAAEAERQRADEERQRALAAQQEAVQQAAAAEAERQRADEERQRALAAQQEAMQQAAAAEVERLRADEERQRALAAQEEALQQAQAAEAERQRADEERQRALAAQQEAVQQAQAAETERQRADEERRRAVVAQAEAIAQANAAEAARQDAMQQAAAAEAARDREMQAQQQVIALERQRAEEAFRRSILEQVADRISALQQAGSWGIASNLLGALWQGAISQSDRQEGWLIEPIVRAFARQSMAEYPIFPEFLNYSGFTGWTGTSGRFRIYALDRKAADGSTIPGNNIMATFDAMTGAVLGSFELPGGSDLGSEPDLVSPDGSTVAIVTDKAEIALWRLGEKAPTLIGVPDRGDGKVVVSELAPVHTDARFAIYLTLDDKPDQIMAVDPAKPDAPFTVSAEQITAGAGLESLDDLKLLGLVDGRLMLLVNKADAKIVTVDASDGKVAVMETGSGVSGAELTPDGALLLTLTCPGSCTEQHLTGFDVKSSAPLWVERVPVGMNLSEPSAQMINADGKATYSALVQNKGVGIAFSIPVGGGEVERLPVDSNARMGETSFDGSGSFRTVESAKDVTSDEGISAAGLLASYRIPLSRQKLQLYIARNSVAIYQGGDAVRVAGVTYSGDLLVYRQREDGEFEEDVAFRSLNLGYSNCLSAVAFGGDGKSLLIRHSDGSLQYVAAIGHGASIGWRKITGEGAALEDSSPPTDCDAPAADAPVERIAAADRSGKTFALLDKDGVAWWVNVVDGAAAGDAPGRSSPGQREFAPLQRLADGISWLAGDPARDRVAIVTRSAVEIATRGTAIADAAPVARGDVQAAEVSQTEAATGPVREGQARQRLARWNEPKATAFSLDGNVVVAYGGGQISTFHQGEAGAWSVKFDNVVFRSKFVGLYAARSGIAVADDRNTMLAIDAENGALTGFARLPANPSALALQADGKALSLEWDTDSVSTIAFREIESASPPDAARLVAMRSLLDVETDASLDSLMIEQRRERSTSSAAGADCANAAALQVPLLELRVLGKAPSEAVVQEAERCAAADGQPRVSAAQALAERGAGASVRELVNDAAFSRVLQGAAAGDETDSRILGATLARIAIDRGDLDQTVIAKDAIRFGTNLPDFVLPPIAAGDLIDPDLLEVARRHTGADPAAHQLVAHWSERQLNDIASLADALLEFSLAERLYRALGRPDDAKFAAHRRAQLARLLPDARVLQVSTDVEAWKPETHGTGSHAPLADLPTGAAERRAFDAANAEELAARLPDSPLLDTLRTELERARIIDLKSSDPKAAAELLIDLGRSEGEAAQWSPDLLREYLGLAEELGAGNDPTSALRLAAEALNMIGSAFDAPIHTNSETTSLFLRAADLVAASAPSAERDAVASAMDAVDLSPVTYEYGSLPGTKATDESAVAQKLLEATARMAEAIAGNSDDAARWGLLRALSLFWQGVLINDTDSAKALPVLQSAAAGFRMIVDATPGDTQVRFRFAEALRWVGLVASSSEETAATERESIGQYRMLWDDRANLDSGLIGRVGVGYGFALANLAQTVRETALADLGDGRSADEHAGWLLEVLRLAAEKDDLNAALIQSGAASGDSEFVAGWYRMSSYGWPIGFVSGLVNIESGGDSVVECDLLAADPYDPLRRAPGIALDAVDVAKAEAVCRAETEANPGDAREKYQLARLISSDEARESEYMPLARAAAEEGVSPAYGLVAYALSKKTEDRSAEAYVAEAQWTVIESFPVLYPFLKSRAKSDSDRLALAWYAGKAAALGVPEAHLALADVAKNPQERLFRLQLAARLFDEAEDPESAADARQRSNALLVRAADQRRIETEVAEWTPEALVDLPADSETN